jgi:HEAT repeat protein
VVVVCVAIFVGFGWIAYDRQTTREYLNDLSSYWPHRRQQAAYELSQILLTDPQALTREPGAAAEVRRLFVETRDAEIRQYLALVLGHTYDPQSLPLLTEALEDPDPKTRIYAIWALGTLGLPEARQPLVELLSDPDPGVRKTATFSLGELGDPAAVPALEQKLGDGVTDVRWNAALALARLGSDAGADVLMQMVDREVLAGVTDITPEQQQEAMLNAIPALAATRGEEARATLDRLAAEDPSLKVRQAAIEARKALGAVKQ